MRRENRHKPKDWFKLWMFWAIFYPGFFIRRILTVPFKAAEDVRNKLFEWDFPNK